MTAFLRSSRAKTDERGRLHIPTTERERASIPLDSEVQVVPKSPGHIELILVGEARLERVQKNMRGQAETLEGRRTQSRQSPKRISLQTGSVVDRKIIRASAPVN